MLERELPLLPGQESALQRRLIASSESGAPLVPFNLPPFIFQLRGRFDLERCVAAARSVTRRHGALRIRFLEQGGRMIQIASDPSDFADIEVEVLDGSASTLKLSLRRWADRPFPLACTPRWRLLLARSGSLSVLAFCFDHMTCDLIGAQIAMAAWADEYAGRGCASAGRYEDVIEAEVDSQADQSDDIAYWLAAVGEDGVVPELDAPFLGPDRNGRGSALEMLLPDAVGERLASFARTHRTTTFTVFLATVHALGLRWSSAPQTLVFPVANRREPASLESVAYLSHLALSRVSVSLGNTTRGLVAETHSQLARDRDHHGLPYAALLRAAAPSRFGVSRTRPWLRVSFVDLRKPFRLPGVDVVPMPIDPTPPIDRCLEIGLMNTEAGLVLSVSADKDTLRNELLSALASDAQSMLSWMIFGGHRSVGDVPLRLGPDPRLGSLGGRPRTTRR